tara:strand:- start:62 stop:280 length:219 start_codon:yes stop_codon:yes gene_type:complete
MLAAARSTSCHGGGKPTGYISLMDKKGGKREKKKWAVGSESTGCVGQRNCKNSGTNGTAKTAETLISPTVAN